MKRPLALLWRLFRCRIAGRVVTPEDFGDEYSEAAPTYDRWLEKMAVHADAVLPATEELRPGMRILDLACGTGYLSQRLLALSGASVVLTGVDISAGMLERCRRHIDDPRAVFLRSDALKFLAGRGRPFDLILCGWALAYLDRRKLFRLAASRLAHGGTLRLIANGSGSAFGVEAAVRRALLRHPEQLAKYPELTGNLPADAAQLRRWGEAAGLQFLAGGEGLEKVACGSAEAWLDWQRRTGALAGLGRTFVDFDAIRPAVVAELKPYADRDGLYRSRHPYVWAIWRKP